MSHHVRLHTKSAFLFGVVKLFLVIFFIIDSFVIILEVELVFIIWVYLSNRISFLVILLIIVFILANNIFLIILFFFIIIRAFFLILIFVFTVSFIITFLSLKILHVLLHLEKVSDLILIHFDFTAAVQIIHNLLLVFIDEKWLFLNLLELLLVKVIRNLLVAEDIFFTILDLIFRSFLLLSSLVLIFSSPLSSFTSLLFWHPIFTNRNNFTRLVYPFSHSLGWSNTFRTFESITHGFDCCSILIVLALARYLPFLNIKLALDELALLVNKLLLHICMFKLSHWRTKSLSKIIHQHLILLLKLLLKYLLLFLLLFGQLLLVPYFRLWWVAKLLEVFINGQISLFKGRSVILKRFYDLRRCLILWTVLCHFLTRLLLDATRLARSVHDFEIAAVYDALYHVIILRGRIIKLICSRTFLLWLRWIFHLNMYLIFR